MNWIEKIAREHGTGGWQTIDDMVKFGEAIAKAECESCAKVCDDAAKSLAACPKSEKNTAAISALENLACRIRARSNVELTGEGRTLQSG